MPQIPCANIPHTSVRSNYPAIFTLVALSTYQPRDALAAHCKSPIDNAPPISIATAHVLSAEHCRYGTTDFATAIPNKRRSRPITCNRGVAVAEASPHWVTGKFRTVTGGVFHVSGRTVDRSVAGS
jgi:hypothetical protein